MIAEVILPVRQAVLLDQLPDLGLDRLALGLLLSPAIEFAVALRLLCHGALCGLCVSITSLGVSLLLNPLVLSLFRLSDPLFVHQAGLQQLFLQ
jgi:hypothetical protein